MEIMHCTKCEHDWCYRGVGRPIRCGKCKSPYWDRERGNEGGEQLGEGADGDEEAIDRPGKRFCRYESWNEQDGENYRCMLPVHGPKVKHGCWRKL